MGDDLTALLGLLKLANKFVVDGTGDWPLALFERAEPATRFVRPSCYLVYTGRVLPPLPRSHMGDPFKYDVFLSHNAADKPRVRRLAERLRKAGVRVWFDDWTIKAGDVVALKVDEGLEQSRILLLCISPAALASRWVALERSTAVHRDPANEGRRFIPLLLGHCELPDTLRRYKHLDFLDESEGEFAEVLASCQVEVESTPTTSRPQTTQELKDEWPDTVDPAQADSSAVELEHSLRGHQTWIMGLLVSPTGNHAVSSSADETIRIWDLMTGRCQASLEAKQGNTPALAITHDGNRILVGSSDHAVGIWDFHSGQRLAILKGHTDRINAIALLPGKNRALSGGFDNTLRIWDLDSHRCVGVTSCGTSEDDKVLTIATSRARNLALTGHADGRLRKWDLGTNECTTTLISHSGDVSSIAITADDRFCVSSSADRTIRIWDLREMTCIGTLEGHTASVLSVAISNDGTLVASAGGSDNTVRLWDWKSGTCLHVLGGKGHSFVPRVVAFSPDGLRLIVGLAGYGYVHVYRLLDVRSHSLVAATRRYVNAKVVLLGEGTVGKTSLAHRLIEDQYVIHDRTHGMNVWRLDLPLLSDDSLDREVLLWDLAGQEDYRLIHQLFLEQTALALLLINPQKDDPFVEAGDWLKALKSAGTDLTEEQDIPRLLIFSQIDVGGMKVGNAKIARFLEEHSFAAWLATSAKSGENCSDHKNGGLPSKLKQLIATSIPWDRLPWTSTPRLLTELKNAVMAMRDELDIRLLRFSELAQRLELAMPGEKFVEPDLRAAVTLLANHGLVHPLKFGDLVLLRPDLVNGYAGAVIRAARAHSDEIGCVLEADIYKSDFDFTGVERLSHRPDEELLLRALVQTFLDHSLCIAEDTSRGRHLVFPSQYRRDRDAPRNPEVFVSYSFSGEWQTVWTTLVVRLWYSQEFVHRELWRNAAEFESTKGHTLGLQVEKQGDGVAKISVHFDVELPDELKVLFIEYVHRHLERYARQVVRDRRYVCRSCGKPVVDREAVRKRLEAGKDFITCQECDARVLLIDFVEQRLRSDPVARKILSMEQAATRKLDTQALEQILIGHMMAIVGEANQIFRSMAIPDLDVDGEVEFKDNDGRASGKKIYVMLKSGAGHVVGRDVDGSGVLELVDAHRATHWISLPMDIYVVIRQKDTMSGEAVIRWMNLTRCLKERRDQTSTRILFQGDKLDMEALWRVRDELVGR